MLRDTPGTTVSVPAAEVPTWVAEHDVEIKIGTFLATLIVYDASAYLLYFAIFTKLIFNSKLSQWIERYLCRHSLLARISSVKGQTFLGAHMGNVL